MRVNSKIRSKTDGDVIKGSLIDMNLETKTLELGKTMVIK